MIANTEQAKALAQKSKEVRAERKRLLQEAGLAVLPPSPKRPGFAELRLVRVRKQLDRLDAMIAEATEPKAIKELADAAHRLAEQERVLAGRPLPGSLKPDPLGRKGRASPGLQIIEQIAVPMTNAPTAPPEQPSQSPPAQPATEQQGS